MDEVKKTETELTWQQQMEVLKDWTERTGSLHEAQILQLKMLPVASLPHIDTKFQIKVNVKKKYVRYDFKRNLKVKVPKDLKKRYDIITTAIKSYFGKEWHLRIYLKKQMVLKTK